MSIEATQSEFENEPIDGGDDLIEDQDIDHEDAEHEADIEEGEDSSTEEADLSDDPAVSAAVDILTSLGISREGRELYAAGGGDFSFLDEFARSLRGADRKRAETAVSLLKGARERFEKADEIRREEEERHVHKVAGGKKQWASLQKFAETHADKAELDDIEGALNMGGRAATMAVRYLQVCKALKDAGIGEQSTGTGTSSAIKPTARVNRGNGDQINDAWYASKVKDLSSKYGSNMTNTAEFARINAAWEAARNRRAYR